MQISKGSLTAHSDPAGTSDRPRESNHSKPIPDLRWNAPKALREAASVVTDQAVKVGTRAVTTAKIIISTEERLRQRIRSILRVALATVFFAISGLVSLGANVTTAFAKKVSSARRHHGLRIKPRYASLRYHHATSGMRGVASWYGREFNRRRTASGVRFDTHAMMAAHRTLPFGTKVRVTNLENQKSCIVEITDRGPFAQGRIIDLSYAAAEKIGMADKGIAQVQLEILGTSGPSILEDIAAQGSSPILDEIPTAHAVNAFVVDEPAP